ncbi:MAG TPA: DUF4038 domain-containing protein [Thermomicrobiales bacterium]
MRQESVTTESDPTVHAWGRWEGAYVSAVDRARPTQAVELWADFAGPTGERRRARGFWDGDRTWRLRFSPDVPGTWTYRTTCSDSSDSGLHGQTGSFTCTPYEGGNPLYRHGAVNVATEGRYFEHADGTPFFFLADTCWNGPHLAEPEDWVRYLSDRAAKRFSAVIFTAPHFRGLAADADGRTAYSGREQIEIDPVFFRRLDRTVDAMNDRGLLAVPLLLHAGKDTERNAGHHLPQDQAIALARYVVARYDAHHVLWNLVAEAEFHGWGARYWQQVARAVFANGRNHPVTLHPYGMDWALYSFLDEPWMDVVGYQSAHGDNEAYLRWIPQGPPSWSWVLHPPRPFVNLEPPYEGHLAYHSGTPFDAATVRRHTYWSLLSSPVAGVGYGGHGVWGWDDGTGTPFAHESTGKSAAWHEAIHLPGSTSMRHLAELMASLPWWQLRPAPEILAAQPGLEDARLTVVASRSEDGSISIVYAPRGSRATLRLGVDESPVRSATLIDPASGDRTPLDAPAGGGEWAVPLPNGEDWLVLLER